MEEPELHPDLRARLEEGAGAPPLHTVSVDTARAGLLARYGSLERVAVASVEDLTISGGRGDIRIRIYRAKFEVAPVVVYFHGGGFVTGSLDTHDALCRYLCVGSNVTLVAVDYPLAPEYRYPAALNDCLDATRWVFENASTIGCDARRLVLAGDSAGANLAAVVALSLSSSGGPLSSAQLLAYPVVDASNLQRKSYLERGEGCGLTAEAMQWFFGHYLDRPEQAHDPMVSPLLYNDLSCLPPTWLLTAEFDPLRDEGLEFAKRLEFSGVDLCHVHQSDANHGFLNWAGTNEPSKQVLDAACKWLASRVRP